MYDLIIIGGGPAGISAGVYAARKQLRTLFITKDWGGQSTVSVEIQNWIGTPAIAGSQLALDLKNHLLAYAGEWVTISEGKTVTALVKNPDETFTVTQSDGSEAISKAVLIASGSNRRRLDIPNADTFEHKGVTYCASCDGPIFSGQDVVVVGGGNAGFETAAQLLAYTKSVTLLQHGPAFKADPVTVEKVLAHPNMKALTNAKPKAVIGDKFVSGIEYTAADGSTATIATTGIFVEIGMLPNTDFARPLVDCDDIGRVKIDPWTQATNVPGIWAAGDCTNVKYHQNNISAGDAVKALEDIYVHLKTR
jgi:NADH-dependent peroxiredoxin subunit F